MMQCHAYCMNKHAVRVSYAQRNFVSGSALMLADIEQLPLMRLAGWITRGEMAVLTTANERVCIRKQRDRRL